MKAARRIDERVVSAPGTRARILWLAVADGRGHRMRAQLMRRLLAPVGVDAAKLQR